MQTGVTEKGRIKREMERKGERGMREEGERRGGEATEILQPRISQQIKRFMPNYLVK